VAVTQSPALTVVKTASPASVSAVGDVITYSFLVTNTGNVTLTGIVVTDAQTAPAGALTTGPTCPSATLAPAASETCTATYTVTQADLDNGSVNDTATASGTPPTGPPVTSPPSTAIVTVAQSPALTVVKTASPATVSAAGDTITYSFLVTNTGNVTLTGVTVNETSFTGTGTLSPLSCPGGGATIASLAPGTSATCTATYVVTQADVNAGSITNTATGTGIPPTGSPVTSPPSTKTVTIPPVKKLGLVKQAHGVDVNDDGVIGAGDRVDWTLIVTNLGTVTITNIHVSDPTAGTVTCPATSLAPGQSMTCTVASHTITADDVKAGSVANVATVSGSGGTGTTAKATVPVHPVQTPPLAFTGNDSRLQIVLAALLLGVGGLITLAGTRRRRTSTRRNRSTNETRES
jgi:uncharacterized repeat protein (TIGR01451 family)